jgi:osmoprotectant transport system substrate-binding protein
MPPALFSTRAAALGLLTVALAGGLAACGTKPTSSPTSSAPVTSGSAGDSSQVCQPVPGSTFVTLADDKKLQKSDNIVPLVRTVDAKAPLTDVLNKISAVLSQEKLNALNAAVSTQKEPNQQAAQEFVAANGLGSGFSGGSGAIHVVASGFSESTTLAYVYADALKAAGYDSSVKQSTDREIYLPLLEKGTYDVIPEYAATLSDYLNDAANGTNATSKASSDIDTTMAGLRPLAAAKGLTVLNPAAATDENAYAVTTAFANKYHVTTLSQLAATCGGGITLGGTSVCPTRTFCLHGLEQTYGLKITKFTALDTDGSLTRNALTQGKVVLAEVFSSDADVKPAT